MSDEDQPHPPRVWDLDRYRQGAEQPPGPEPVFGHKMDAETEAMLAASFDADLIRVRYFDEGTLFPLALKTGLLSVITLGLYRFWMITRLRRYYCAAIRIDGDPLEYTGTGLEKFLGFLLAIVILAVYLGLVNLGLAFINLSYLDGNPLAFQISILAVVPLYFWAAYRARRYFLARLRWRGIRFGAEPGAWGYMFRSVGLVILTVLTAGLALPYQHFKQAQYMTDRTWFGDMRLEQRGSWWGLFAYWIWIYVSAAMAALLTWGIIAEGGFDQELAQVTITVIVTLWIPFAMFLYFTYQIGSFRYLWDNRVLGEAEIGNDVSTLRVFGTYVGGYILVVLLSTVAAAAIAVLVAGLWIVLGGPSLDQLAAGAGAADDPAAMEQMVQSLLVSGPFMAIILFAYLLFFATSYALTQVFLIQPILKRKIEAMMITNPRALRLAAQRGRDDATEAGGFADALGVDPGAGF